MNKGLIGGIIGGVAVIVIAAILIGLFINRTGSPGGEPSDTAPPETATSAVKGFLDALAAGDVDTALSYAKETPDDTTFMTKEILAASAKDYPITDINVPEATSDYQVAATYKIGSQTVNAKYSTIKIGDSYKITEIGTDVRLSSVLADGLPMKINGVAVDPSTTTVTLLPGGYTITTDSKWIGYGNGKIVVTSPTDYPDTSKLQPTIKSDATAAVVTAAKAKLAACVKEKSLKPAGCGISLAPNSTQKVTTSSITYKVKSGGDFKGLKLRLDYDDPTTATGTIDIKVAFAAKGTCSGKKCTFSADVSIRSLNADLSKDTPVVTFERY